METQDQRGRSVLLPARTERTSISAFTIDPASAEYLTSIRVVLSLGGDTSFDPQITELAKTAHDLVKGFLCRELGPTNVVDHYTDRPCRLRLSERPDPTMPLVLTHFSGEDANYGQAVGQTFDTDDLNGVTLFGEDDSYWYEPASQTLVYQMDSAPTDMLSRGHEFPVRATYATIGIDTDPLVRAGIENLVLALFNERHGGGGGETQRVGAVMNSVRRMLEPLAQRGL